MRDRFPPLPEVEPVDPEQITDIARSVAIAGRGALGYAQVVANQTGITAIADLTGLSVDAIVGVSRRIRVTGRVIVAAAATPIASLWVREGATTLHGGQMQSPSGNGESLDVVWVSDAAPSSGVHTYKLSLTGTGSAVDMIASGTAPAFILVEDIGPAD